MKFAENLFARLSDTEAIVDAVYKIIAVMDTHHREEMETYRHSLQALTQEISGAEAYILALQQELAAGLRCALWAGFQWNLDCFRNPVNKLMLNLDFEELCREDGMHLLPQVSMANRGIRNFWMAVPEEKQSLLDSVADHYAYLKTWGYKLAFYEGFCLADRLLPHLLPGYTGDTGLSLRCEKKLRDCLRADSAA